MVHRHELKSAGSDEILLAGLLEPGSIKSMGLLATQDIERLLSLPFPLVSAPSQDIYDT